MSTSIPGIAACSFFTPSGVTWSRPGGPTEVLHCLEGDDTRVADIGGVKIQALEVGQLAMSVSPLSVILLPESDRF